MKANENGSNDAQPPETDDLFETANLFPRTTGLPMTVWVTSRGNARHDAKGQGQFEPRQSDEPGERSSCRCSAPAARHRRSSFG
jgi:hypothetical protein